MKEKASSKKTAPGLTVKGVGYVPYMYLRTVVPHVRMICENIYHNYMMCTLRFLYTVVLTQLRRRVGRYRVGLPRARLYPHEVQGVWLSGSVSVCLDAIWSNLLRLSLP
jgi:hypothetical protein